MNPGEEMSSKGNEPVSALSKPMPFSARTGCLLVSFVGLLLVLVCLGSAQLLARGEISWRQGDLRENRVWLLREADVQGLALSRMRIVSGSEREGQACIENQVRFWLWAGEPTDPGTSYCECFEDQTGIWRSKGECPP